MKLYHGTTMPGIESLNPNSVDREGKPALYLTDNRAYSLFYIRDREIDFVTCRVGRDGRVHYDEKFPGQLKLLYQGRSGYIYETEAEAQPTKTRGIWICREAGTVTSKTYISNVYDAIMAEIEGGNVAFFPYEQLTEQQRQMNQEGALREFLSGRPMHPRKLALYQQYFPEAWKEAQNLLAQRK